MRIGWIRLVPGVSWIVTYVKDPISGIKEKSIRPAFIGNIGLGIPFGKLSLIWDVRAEYVMEDDELDKFGKNINITGKFISTYLGLGLYF